MFRMRLCPKLPKVGEVGIQIPTWHFKGDWEFNSNVVRFMQRYGIAWSWFQCFDANGWVWTHGVVELKDGRAIVTQIG